MAQQDKRQILYSLLQEGLDHLDFQVEAPDFLKNHIEKMILHIMPDHPWSSTSWFVTRMFMLLKPDAIPEEIEQAEILGWIYQMFQASQILLDDITDQGEVRYGGPTWAKLNNFQVSSLSFDFSMLDSIIYYLLEKYFGHLAKTYDGMVRNFRKGRLQTAKGNWMELAVSGKCEHNSINPGTESFVGNFGFAEWGLLAELKYSVHVHLPVYLAMAVAGKVGGEQSEAWCNVDKVTNKICQYMAMSDDYFDIFTSHRNHDTKYSDAKQGLLTWLWIAAKTLCKNEAEWSVFLEKYGRDDEECLQWITDFFERRNISAMFTGCRVKLEAGIQSEISNKFGNIGDLAETLQWWFKTIKIGFELDELGELDVKQWRRSPKLKRGKALGDWDRTTDNETKL